MQQLHALVEMLTAMGISPPAGLGLSSPASHLAIRSLPRHKVAPTSSLLERECQICMSAYELEEEVMTLPCLHIYHMECAEKWLARKPTCPICLTRIDAQHDHDGGNDTSA